MVASDSRTNGNGGTSLTIASIDRLTASLHASACAKSGSPVAATSAFNIGLASLVSRPIQSRSPVNAGSRAAAATLRALRQKIHRQRQPRKSVRPRHFEYRLTHSNVSRAYRQIAARP